MKTLKGILIVLVGLIIFMQAVSVSADMVVFWSCRVVDRSTLRAKVYPNMNSGQIQIAFYWGTTQESGMGCIAIFLCNEKYSDKYKETVDAIFKSFDKDKYINPVDIFNKAGLTGWKVIEVGEGSGRLYQ